MLISQTVSSLETPSLREALLFGGARAGWSRVFDEAATFRHDESVLRVLEADARREEHRRDQERRQLWCMPIPVATRIGRPHIFRALFRKNIGGVTGVSDVWCDCDFVGVDGVSGKMMSWIDYVDTAHLISQTASANQCAMPLATALFANAKCAYFSGVQLYDSNRAPSLFSFGHDGSGSAISAAFSVDTTSPNHVCLCTGQSGVSNVNSFQFGTVVGQTYYQVFKTAASANIVLNVAGSIGANQPTYMTGMFTSPNWSLRQRSTVINTGGQSVTPDPGSPASTLRVGAGGVSVGNVWVGNIRSFYLLRRTLSAAELAVMQAWYLKDTGIPLT